MLANNLSKTIDSKPCGGLGNQVYKTDLCTLKPDGSPFSLSKARAISWTLATKLVLL